MQPWRRFWLPQKEDRSGSSAESRILRFSNDGGGLPTAAAPIIEISLPIIPVHVVEKIVARYNFNQFRSRSFSN
jgi:hypothetical protein